MIGAFLPIMKRRRGVERPALFESVGRWIGPPRRTLAFRAMARPSGSRPSFDDGWDFATW